MAGLTRDWMRRHIPVSWRIGRARKNRREIAFEPQLLTYVFRCFFVADFLAT
jgi:hypothetical protein